MRPIIVLLLLLALKISLPSLAGAHSFDLRSQQVTTLETLVADLSRSQVVFIGETHDQRAHHAVQLQLIQELHQAGDDISIGLEMFRRDGQPELDKWVAGEIDEAEFSRIFQRHWSDWGMYRDIFVYARDNNIPMLGLNIHRELISQVAKNGFASLSAAQRQKLPLATCNISEQYRKFIRRTLSGHPLDGAEFEHFCEAQILWDASMAAHIDEQLQLQPQQTIVVLAGIGHSWKHGIKEQLDGLGDYRSRVLLPEIPGRLDLRSMTVEDADFLLQGIEQAPLH